MQLSSIRGIRGRGLSVRRVEQIEDVDGLIERDSDKPWSDHCAAPLTLVPCLSSIESGRRP